MKVVDLGAFKVGGDAPFALIAGPCVIESKALVFQVAERLGEICESLGISLIFKASYDKANRSAGDSFRGVGRLQGLDILAQVKQRFGLLVLTDVHSEHELPDVSAVADVLQIPAFLCRQTDLIMAAAQTGRVLNIKKGQFLAPLDMCNVVDKVKSQRGASVQTMVCERGASFGYNNLVVDMRSLVWMRQTGCPVIFDATHSVQLPGGLGKCSGGQRGFVPALARAAVGIGVAGLFMETHPEPDRALSDGPNMWPLSQMESLLKHLQALDKVVKSEPMCLEGMLAG